MEPAVKPAAEQTKTGVVGVLATPATFQGALYASVVERFAAGVTVLQDTCPGLVNQIEKGELESDQTRTILEKALFPMIHKRIDTVVLGCTHYPFVIPLIEKICGPQIRVIDPAPSVARQTQRILDSAGLIPVIEGNSDVEFLTSGIPERFTAVLRKLLVESAMVQKATWNGLELQ